MTLKRLYFCNKKYSYPPKQIGLSYVYKRANKITRVKDPLKHYIELRPNNDSGPDNLTYENRCLNSMKTFQISYLFHPLIQNKYIYKCH